MGLHGLLTRMYTVIQVLKAPLYAVPAPIRSEKRGLISPKDSLGESLVSVKCETRRITCFQTLAHPHALKGLCGGVQSLYGATIMNAINRSPTFVHVFSYATPAMGVRL